MIEVAIIATIAGWFTRQAVLDHERGEVTGGITLTAILWLCLIVVAAAQP